MKNNLDELTEIKKRYQKRFKKDLFLQYLANMPDIYMSSQEKERVFFHFLDKLFYKSISNAKILEVGCGRGTKILDLLRMGFSPENIIGNELMKENILHARNTLPNSIKLLEGDARTISIEMASLDFVYQSMVFSSILDYDFKKDLAEMMWSWIKPGGAVIWYDFVYNNPKNLDVRKVSISEIQKLFPHGRIYSKKVTLAPPISRFVTKLNPTFYTVFNVFPFLRSHIVCFITKS